MKVQLNSLEKDYHLSIAYPVKADLAESWDLIASNAGFTKWFPQLRIEEDKLVFEMEDFREEMELLAYQENQVIAYDWDGAKVPFNLKIGTRAATSTLRRSSPKTLVMNFPMLLRT